MVWVPAGSFQRDSNAVNISVISQGFTMSKYEITRQQFLDVMGMDPSDTDCSSGMSDPVQMVNWYHAIAFCNKLSLSEGLTPVYSVSGVDFSSLTYAEIPTSDNADWNGATADWSADGYRLPTEMEWMWAAMGVDTAAPGEVNTIGYAKAFAGSDGSNVIDDYAWYYSNSGSKTHPVGTKTANELGLHDMSGNVFEWAWDCRGIDSWYPSGILADYLGEAEGPHRIGRGGSWVHDVSLCTIARRSPTGPSNQAQSYGFRLVRL